MERTVTLSVRVTEAENTALKAMAASIGYGVTPAGIVYQAIQDTLAAHAAKQQARKQ